ncbi:MAG: UDP-diphosphatase [Candidatus Moranbacteria bacterium CG_4_10_14_3_um_filter_44_15]|nr:MAG: UDP-diphosphatase [Candidatus Moranbacteria bacterium CG06_land_8_20_14_3_00_43_56]PIW92888.1 MAG: UDP-diphosphatase [Candidatus Moranbacteria bacterium CG_4_8_14_3_um_filter_43_15]PIX90727.1 MAG: UDP-diphosphatase [Candidatus Moranbacteria bacterium CG_4_10_14_3_um_filter_44_15]PJA85668.1 MAG: UDP-diphosphatase [Candidatus Moranbacteria bacterium CG_4_9_14_3_um_filter_44_28]
MTILQSIFLGLIQGASEFLPISSSAHLILAPWLFGFSDPGLAFDVALHFGTLVAVVLYFWRDWIEIISNIKYQISNIHIKNQKENTRYEIRDTKYGKNLLWFLILATIPGILAGYFLESYAEKTFRSPVLIAITLSLVGLILYLVDKYHKHRREIGEIGWLDSLIIGLAQAVAIIPGVSRSGATITTGLLRGLNRQSAARFSFLLSTPIIFGAAVKQFPDFLSAGISLPIAAGIISSAVSGYLVIKYLLKFIEKAGYAMFFWYRLGLAAVILLIYYIG